MRDLTGRNAVITGVSRRQGIGYAIASRLADAGASLYLQHWSAHDAEQPWGADPIAEVMAPLQDQLHPAARLAHGSYDLAQPGAASQMIKAAASELGPIDILICNHARSGGDGQLADITADLLDGHWQVNARATILATQAFAAQHDQQRPGGRVIWLTSGQQLGPMRQEVAYVASKAALAGLTATVADDLIERGIVLNTVNPGPVNTGYLNPGTSDREDALEGILRAFPGGRFGEPDDPARLISWLVSDAGRWVVGQVINTEGGFRRWV